MSRVLLVEPYFSGSHQAWAEGYARTAAHDVEPISLPGRFWKWRMFGGSLTLARKTSQLSEPPDLILASDMLDLASFLGHAGLAPGVRSILYMHENQLTYPLSPTARDDLAYAYMNWSSMVRADEVWFNSRFHLDSVFEALPKFLRHFPDHRHTPIVEETHAKSTVMPVGVDLSFVTDAEKPEPPLVIWNQRWEHDKNPQRMWDALVRLGRRGSEFQVAICGENFANTPEGFEEGRKMLGDRVVHYGYASRARYCQLLNDASVVLSTALHEFFGIAVVEAMAAGAVPVLPNGLSYPELVPKRLHAETLYNDDDRLDELLTKGVEDGDRRNRLAGEVAAAMERYDWGVVGRMYDEGINRLLAEPGR